MSIRSRLTLLMLVFGLSLLVSFGALVLLGRTATTGLTTANEALQQQSAALNMQAQLRDAEAALYRYEIEGESGFATRFREQMSAFIAEVDNYERIASSPEAQRWVSDLRSAHRNAVSLGEDLIEQRELQNANLKAITTIKDRAEVLLSGSLRDTNPTDLAYQNAINGMASSQQDIMLALAAYLATPRELDRVEFLDSIATYQAYHEQFEALPLSNAAQGLAKELEIAGDEMEALGSQLISRRTQRRADYANFALVLFQAAQGTIVDEIQPQIEANLTQASSALDQALRMTFFISLGIALLSAGIFAAVTLPLLRRMNKNIGALLRGADAVAAGDLSTNVEVDDQHEFQKLATAFNNMTDGLTTRDTRLRELIHKMSLVQEEERRLVGLDLHDGLTQMLLSANMHLNAFESKFKPAQDAKIEAQFDRGKKRLREAIDEVRWVVSELRPTELEDFGLIDGMHRYVNKVANAQGWQADFEANLGAQHLPDASETAIFRIVQEALSNARKHANTNRIQVKLHTDAAALHINVKDWGKGFDPKTLTAAPEQFGVIGMEERAQLIGGKFSLTSSVGQGTEIAVQIPLENFEQLSTKEDEV